MWARAHTLPTREPTLRELGARSRAEPFRTALYLVLPRSPNFLQLVDVPTRPQFPKPYWTIAG